ncbi:MAG: M20/M25/M40 family metallo-hydrolase [Dehalococcoidales bacterium]|nr:M20/M25/M40 family metallo-hydrolase [Dehalococcoidales bacterium]
MEVEKLLSDLIRIESVNPPGNETGVARYLKGLFDSVGIKNEIIESAPGRGSFIAEIGEGDKRLLYLSHTDVVPVSDGWDFLPFSGKVEKGFVHGRGALDCKGLAAAEAQAMINLAGSGKLGGKLIFAAAADEEVGGSMGVKYLVDNFKEKISADFVINEGGEEPACIGDGVSHFIQVGEKGICWLKLRAEGVSAHGSLPLLGDNAVTKMAAALTALTEYRSDTVLIPEVKVMLGEIARLAGLKDRATKSNIDRIIDGVGNKTFGAYLSAITRMTISPNMVCGGSKTNIIPDRCEADVDIRVLPGQDEQYVIRELNRIAGNVKIEILRYRAPTFSTSKSEFYRLMSKTLKQFVGNVPVLPSISSGGTDSGFFRDAGIPCYGISMMTVDTDKSLAQSVHGKNEKLDVASLRLKTDFLVDLARKYLGN